MTKYAGPDEVANLAKSWTLIAPNSASPTFWNGKQSPRVLFTYSRPACKDRMTSLPCWQTGRIRILKTERLHLA